MGFCLSEMTLLHLTQWYPVLSVSLPSVKMAPLLMVLWRACIPLSNLCVCVRMCVKVRGQPCNSSAAPTLIQWDKYLSGIRLAHLARLANRPQRSANLCLRTMGISSRPLSWICLFLKCVLKINSGSHAYRTFAPSPWLPFFITWHKNISYIYRELC